MYVLMQRSSVYGHHDLSQPSYQQCIRRHQPTVCAVYADYNFPDTDAACPYEARNEQVVSSRVRHQSRNFGSTNMPSPAHDVCLQAPEVARGRSTPSPLVLFYSDLRSHAGLQDATVTEVTGVDCAYEVRPGKMSKRGHC